VVEFYRYFGQVNGLRGQFGGLPPWARSIVAVVALPGLVLVGLSVLALVVSLLALLAVTGPVYMALARLTAGRGNVSSGAAGASPLEIAVLSEGGPDGAPPVKRIESTVIK
jgi:hypothetical protein